MTKTFMVKRRTPMEDYPPRQRALMGTEYFQEPHPPRYIHHQAISQVMKTQLNMAIRVLF